LLAGAELSRHPSHEREHVHRIFEGVRVTFPDERFPSVYARLLAWHERGGRRVPTMDLLIATAAVVDRAPLVTRNVKDFARIPDLAVLGY
jgi:predicted nucleic acid-binding protein